MVNHITITPRKELLRDIKKLAKLTGFSANYVVCEILKVSFRSGLVKDLFWLYRKDHNDPFWENMITDTRDNVLLLKDSFTAIESVFSRQETRIKDLEKNHNEINKNVMKGKLKQLPLADYL